MKELLTKLLGYIKNPWVLAAVIGAALALVVGGLVLAGVVTKNALYVLFAPLLLLFKKRKKSPEKKVDEAARDAEDTFRGEISEETVGSKLYKEVLEEIRKNPPSPPPRPRPVIVPRPSTPTREDIELDAWIKVGQRDTEKEKS